MDGEDSLGSQSVSVCEGGEVVFISEDKQVEACLRFGFGSLKFEVWSVKLKMKME